MTQGKVSLLLLILKIYTQLLLLVPARYPGKVRKMGFSQISKRNFTRTAWHTLGVSVGEMAVKGPVLWAATRTGSVRPWQHRGSASAF